MQRQQSTFCLEPQTSVSMVHVTQRGHVIACCRSNQIQERAPYIRDLCIVLLKGPTKFKGPYVVSCICPWVVAAFCIDIPLHVPVPITGMSGSRTQNFGTCTGCGACVFFSFFQRFDHISSFGPRQRGETGLFFAPKLTDWYYISSVST